jgi:RHS repeat-associated protein
MAAKRAKTRTKTKVATVRGSGYDPASNLTTTTTPDGYTETRGYDNANRLTSILTKAGTTTLNTSTYTLDQVGNPTAVTGTNPALYGYDNRDRLTSVCFQTSTCTKRNDPYIAWTYDPDGNRLTETRGVGGTTTTNTYNQGDQQRTAGSTNYSYDHNGNETAAGSRVFAYNATDQLTSATSGTATDIYTYDGDGNRLTDAVGSTTTKYLWDTNNQLSQLALERDANSNLLRRYTIGADTIGYTTPTGSFYYHYDGIGSVVNVTNSTGVKQWTYSYEPYGTARTTTQNATGAPANPLRFTGEYADTTGLYNLRARQYESTSGRFLETDPAAGSFEDPYTASYVYVRDDPTRYVDPSGAEEALPSPAFTIAGGFAVVLAYGFHQCIKTGACNSGVISKEIRDHWALLKKEWKVGGWRVNPNGDRSSNNKNARKPHYHRRRVGPNGDTLPGQGIGRHRPWDKKATDKSFWDRF